MKTIVIAGSASLQNQAARWKLHWEQVGYTVVDYPRPLPADTFLEEYPAVFERFFDHLAGADRVFVMNEDKNGAPGYVGAETFAELAYAVYLRLKSGSRPEILLLQRPPAEARGSEEIQLWERLGLLRYFHD